MNTLFNLQQKLKVGKNQTNKFGGYNFRSAEDIMEALKPLLKDEQAALILSDRINLVGKDVFLEATAILENSEGKTWAATASARHAEEQKGMMDSQLTGATSSYARKYALNGLFLIDDTKDADATNDGTKEKKTPKPAENPKPQESVKKEWLNPGTPNWEHTVKRMKEGMTIEDVKKTFLISGTNEKKIANEVKA